MWPDKRDNKDGQHIRVMQILSYVEVIDEFAMNCHITSLSYIVKMVIPNDEKLEKMIERLDEMKILLEHDISIPIMIF